jgi:hypothetical protein
VLKRPMLSVPFSANSQTNEAGSMGKRTAGEGPQRGRKEPNDR